MQLALNVLVAILRPTEPLVMLALLVPLLSKDLSSPPTVLPVKKDGLPDTQELPNAPSALKVAMKPTELLVSLVMLDLLLSITPREKRNAESVLKDLLPSTLDLLTAPSALLELTKLAEPLAILALQVLTLMSKVQLNASHAFLELTVTSQETLVPLNAKLAIQDIILLFLDKPLAKDAPLVLMKRTELLALTALQEATLLPEPLNVPSAPLVPLLTTTVPPSARSAPLTLSLQH